MVVEVETSECPVCGSKLSREGWSGGLCPGCLFELGLSPDPASPVPADSESPTEFLAGRKPEEGESFTPGQLLGKRYRIESLLGRGGMGEVWQAYDLKLRLEVALKSLHPKLFDTDEGLELLRDEVRAAREVTSPNVCRLYDLVEVGEQELVSMEYVDGVTLRDHLRQQGPLEIREANEIASQLLAGLEVIHQAGLVHRDIKPENVMLTRTGRVLVMDFGLTSPSGTGSMAGTPAYMAPEQARGEAVDARADVFSAGVVLAEMLSAEGGPEDSSRQDFWEAVREDPPSVPESPWKPILQQALSPDRQNRYASIEELVRALEEVAFRVEGAEHEHPYPGLASFQEEDAEFFFGREAEVEAAWKKLARSHLLALIGASGSGKSSFINAGLLPAKPEGWSCLRLTPGQTPFAALGRALMPELEGDAEAMEGLVALEDLDSALLVLRSWLTRHEQALLIVDQFEELFTQTSEDVQRRFSELLNRAALDANVHVFLSMRDDFLMHCNRQRDLKPIFSDLTPLDPPTGAALRRAIVQPALCCGYRFEDESVVEELLEEVTKERGALPLIAFTAAQLWEKRDRETGYLTKKAYEEVGGVGGALAQHAERTLEKVGQQQIDVVREIFRNLVTAQGTRAARDRGEILSVFGRGHDPAETAGHVPTAAPVLDTLIDSRLLTSYEVPADEGEDSRQRIEIIHESLLSNWPRLVRWQTQDAEGAQLRDELRNQAQLWQQHDRAEDYLWTGAAYLDFLAWRERYPGGLTAVEEDFVRAMTTRAERRRRRRRAALAASFAVLLAVLGIVGVFWRQSVAEALRAEAAKLLALGQVHFETDPTEALAFTMASLELADTEEARRSVMRALWAGPPVLALRHDAVDSHFGPLFSPDGRWFSAAGAGGSTTVLVWREDGSGPVVLDGHAPATGAIRTAWTAANELITGHPVEERVRVWSFPGGELVRQIDLGDRFRWQVGESNFLAEFYRKDPETDHWFSDLRSWRLPDGEPKELGSVDASALGADQSVFEPRGRGWIYSKGGEIFYRPLPVQDGASDRLIGTHENEAEFAGCSAWFPAEPCFSADSDRLWTRDVANGELRLWDLSATSAEPLRVVARPSGLEPKKAVLPAVDGRWLHEAVDIREGKALLWDPTSLPGAAPLELKRSGRWHISKNDFHPSGDWIVASSNYGTELSFWALRTPLPTVVSGYDTATRRPVVFTPDGNWLATYWGQDKIRLWPLPGSESREIRELNIQPANLTGLTIDSAGERFFVAGNGHRLMVVPHEGTGPRLLEGFLPTTWLVKGVFSPSGRLAAAATLQATEEHVLRVWELETGEARVFDLPLPEAETPGEDGGASIADAFWVGSLAFTDESTLLTAGVNGVLRWDLEGGHYEQIVSAKPRQIAFLWLSRDRQRMITGLSDPAGQCGPLILHDLPTGSSRELDSFFTCDDLQIEQGWPMLAFDDTLSVMAIGRPDGTLWVGRLGGSSPHLLTGHQGAITGLAISPDGRWIASSGEDKTIRLWPMPDLDKPPLHTLPREVLIAKLRSLTNIRVVRDAEAAEGWSVTLDPFPGWKEVPTW